MTAVKRLSVGNDLMNDNRNCNFALRLRSLGFCRSQDGKRVLGKKRGGYEQDSHNTYTEISVLASFSPFMVVKRGALAFESHVTWSTSTAFIWVSDKTGVQILASFQSRLSLLYNGVQSH